MNQTGLGCQLCKLADPAQVTGAPQGQNAGSKLPGLADGHLCGLPPDVLSKAVMAVRHQDGSIILQHFQFSPRIDPAPGQPVYILDDTEDPVGVVSFQIAQNQRLGHPPSDCSGHIMGLEKALHESGQWLSVDS